eukprot:TRINITY_DN3966_c0_g1_i1.p1 TRINITY_DN3966_c0_g1~~TRINITY_DN3966_c0_g1_i1.p1  ORF type:complete len:390 (+),score=112.26 TRINITY_DN3966_c0_g1_i1:61-1230(+)
MEKKGELTLGVSSEDPYEIWDFVSKLGEGGVGTVWKARDRRSGEFAAVKVIKLEQGDEGLEAILLEIDILKDCRHKNIVNYIGSWLGDNELLIAMEYCGGGSVSDIEDVLDEGLTEEQIASICRDCLVGLQYLHSCKKIHRDIKAGNILLTENGDVKLADFGVSTQLTNTMSKRNSFIGTPYWMAPEVIEGLKYDFLVDVWSLGITAIEMGELLPPYSSVHPMRALFLIPKNPPPELEEEKWTNEFRDFVKSCLVKDPKKRATVEQLLAHPFIKKAKGASPLIELVDKCKEMLQLKQYDLSASDDEGKGTDSATNSLVKSKAKTDKNTVHKLTRKGEEEEDDEDEGDAGPGSRDFTDSDDEPLEVVKVSSVQRPSYTVQSSKEFTFGNK